jgi:RHS repeat-associated protein
MLTTPSGGEISLTHNGYQQLASISDSDGITTHFAQDELDRPVSATAPDGYATRFSYDSAGNLLSVVNPQDAVRSYAYDPAGRLKQITDPLGGISSYAYDKAGRLASIRNQLSHDINFAYDSAGQMVEITLPDDRRYQYQYDPLGNVRKIIDPMQHAWKFSYNDINTLQSIVNPAGESETMAYDSRGRISKRTLRTNEEINYAYDKNGLLTSLSLPESRTIQMSYRSDGLMEALSDSSAAASVTMLYDLEGRRISYADPNGKTMGFTYTPGGRISKIIYPNSHELLHAYDTSGRLQSLTDWLGNVTTFTYDSVDQLTGISLPNGTTSRFVYDSAGELNGIRHFRSDDSDIFASEYTRDATGRIISISGAAFPAPTPAGDSAVSHVYDENNRLLTTIKDGIVAANTFDARGNVVRRQEGPATTSFTYDALNNLLAVTRGSQATMYGYAGGGVRVSKTFDGNTRHYLNDGITLYCTYSPSGVVENYYIYAGNYLIYSLAENGDILVYHADERGNVAAVTNADQVVVETATYGPYGEELSRTGSLVNPFRFMGQLGVLTDENGLLYIRARYYDPGQRRFVNEDPLGVLREPNLYAYAAGDPINYVDPTGLATQKMKASDGKTYNVPAVDISVLRELAKKYKADKDTAAVNEINAISAKLRDYAAEQQLLYVKALEENNGKEDGAKVTVCTETYNEIKEITTELKLERFKFGEVGISREYKGMGNVGHGHFAATLIDVKDPKNPKTVAVIDPIQPGWGWLGQITQKRVVVYNPTSWALQKSWSVGVPSLLTTLTNTAWEIISPAGGSRSPLGKLNATTYDLKHVDWNLQP